MVNFLKEIMMFLGSMTCHQLDSRSIFISGEKLPYCARDVGIYFGFLLSFLYIVIRRRLGANKPLSIKQGLMVCVLLMPMMFDGITSYLGIRETNNVIRIVTGLLFGTSLPFLIVPIANFNLIGENKKYIVKSCFEICILSIVICFVGLFLYMIPINFYLILAILPCTGMIIFSWMLVNTPLRRIKGMRWFTLIIITSAILIGFMSMFWAIGQYIIRPLM